jgi:DNA-binding beta-propeller fold protein YncE
LTDGTITTVSGYNTAGMADGISWSAYYNTPSGIAVNSQDEVYICDTGNSRIRVMYNNAIVGTLAGSTLGCQDGTYSNAKFTSPTGIAIGKVGIYITDKVCDSISLLENGKVTTVVSGIIKSPTDVAFDQVNSTLFVLSDSSNSIYTIDVNGEVTSVNLGNVGFSRPSGLAFCFSRYLCVSDKWSHKVALVNTKNMEIVGYVAGNGTAGYANGKVDVSRIDEPMGLSYHATSSTLFIADSLNNRIRKSV